MIRQLSVRELHERLERGERPLIVDVREPWELAICRLPGSLHIPMRQIPARVNELPKEREIVIMCHHGVRSQQVALFLKHAGFEKLANLAGGIAAWSQDVDPSTPTY
jgi:rhodanese-related sulfurtransferase